ncbi:glycosyl hydrolase family 18 protein [Tuberibacillus sp. Marseille-P3662]|uniref:glycosyl hydrolase family 18 protein n=1 Tax=Tuberibacillus sp. Marseille-P3662 TaxID=1965358 RepID=UPI000A1C8238|nr:glycosyl hydrolase family 18 protein [Tuberibacillus sp. Marseille-P3662]
MFIYTVKSGDSLYSISQKFNVPINQLQLVNGLVQPNIVPGLALLITQSNYVVQPGDSLYQIARIAYVSLDRLMNANPSLNPSNLQPGTQVTLPESPDYVASTFSYLYITGDQGDQDLIQNFTPYSTYFSFFEYHFFSDGSLSQLNASEAIEISWRRNTAPLATITNLTSSGFEAELTDQVLHHPSIRQNLIENIYKLVSNAGYAGVNIDFENISNQSRDAFSTFLNHLSDRLKPEGYSVTIAIPPKTSEDISWLQGYDYGAIGSVVDLMFIMAYDWHYQGSEPGPVAPIDQVRKTVEFALQNVSSDKIQLGVPLYGYDWTLPYNPGNVASAISNQDAANLAIRQGATIQYSEAAQSPFFYYVDQNGQTHVVWFEDSRSIAEKMQLIIGQRLNGIGAWQIGLGFPQGTWLLTEFFKIRRVT